MTDWWHFSNHFVVILLFRGVWPWPWRVETSSGAATCRALQGRHRQRVFQSSKQLSSVVNHEGFPIFLFNLMGIYKVQGLKDHHHSVSPLLLWWNTEALQERLRDMGFGDLAAIFRFCPMVFPMCFQEAWRTTRCFVSVGAPSLSPAVSLGRNLSGDGLGLPSATENWHRAKRLEALLLLFWTYLFNWSWLMNATKTHKC